MDSEDPPDPEEAVRQRIASAIPGLDIGSRKGRVAIREAVAALRALQDLDQRRRAFRLWLATGWSAFAALVVLGPFCGVATVWIVLHSGWSGEAQIAALVAALSALARGCWALLKRAPRRLAAIASADEGDAGVDDG